MEDLGHEFGRILGAWSTVHPAAVAAGAGTPPRMNAAQAEQYMTRDERRAFDAAESPTPAVLPTAPAERKAVPIVGGCLDYFPAALASVASVSKVGNDQHNPGEPMHHARGKSMDHADCLVRHLMDRGTLDTDGLPHTAKVAWRALAMLQEELEGTGAPLARGARRAGAA